MLPNGALLKYRMFGIKGNESTWVSTYIGQEIRFAKEKKKLPLMGGNTATASGQFVAFLDFDRKDIPKGLTENEVHADAEMLAMNLGGVYFQSAGGMAKVAVVFEGARPEGHSAESLTANLFRLVENAGYHDLQWWDATAQAMRVTYLTFEAAQLLARGLPRATIHRFTPVDPTAARKPAESTPTSQEAILASEAGEPTKPGLLARAYHRDEAVAPELDSEDLPGPVRRLLPILQRMWHLNRPEGFNLPTTKLALESGQSVSSVRRAMQWLMEREWLECLSQTFVIGKKAYTYVAHYELCEAIQRRMLELAADVDAALNPKTKALPKMLRSGESYRQLLAALWKFETETEFMAWVREIQPLDAEQRHAKAKSMAASHFRKQKRAA